MKYGNYFPELACSVPHNVGRTLWFWGATTEHGAEIPDQAQRVAYLGDDQAMPAFQRMSDNSYTRALGNFIAVAQDNMAQLELSQADIDSLRAAKQRLDNGITASLAARNAAIAATRERRDSRKSSYQCLVRSMRRVEAVPTVPASLIIRLGMNPPRTRRSRRNVFTPRDLVVAPDASGTVRLKWNRAGNASDTIFTVEARVEGEPSFTRIGSTSKVRYEDKAQLVGLKVDYRVMASRPSGGSGYSNVATAFDACMSQASL